MDRPRGVDAYVAARTHAGKAAQQIADELNAAGVVTASGRPLSTNVVAQKQSRLGIRLKQTLAPRRTCDRILRAYPTIPRSDDNKDVMIRAIALSKKARNERRFRTYSGR